MILDSYSTVQDKLNILFPAGSFYPAQTGGPDNTVYWITKALTRQGHQAVISSTDLGQPDETPVDKWLTRDYGEVIYTRNPVHYLPLGVIRRALGRLREADILHLAMITYPASFVLAILNSWLYGKPIIWSVHGDLDPPMLLRSRRVKATVLWLIRKLVNRRLLWFHSTCPAESTYVRNNFGEGARIIELTNYMEFPPRMQASPEPYLLYIGRIDPKKGIENLVRGLAQSDNFRNGEVVLKIVGDYNHEYGQSLVRLVEEAGLTEKILFLGHRSGEEKERLLAAAGFLLMPSHTENHGIVVMEAAAQGTPSVASTGTPWQILEEWEAGYWTDNDPASLRKIVDHILELSPERRKEMGENAYRMVRKEYSIHEKIGEWESAYRSVLPPSSPVVQTS